MPSAQMIEDYFNNANAAPAIEDNSNNSNNSNNSIYVGFALCAAIILWLKRRTHDDDDSMFIK